MHGVEKLAVAYRTMDLLSVESSRDGLEVRPTGRQEILLQFLRRFDVRFDFSHKQA